MSGDTLTVTLSTTDNPNATLHGVATDNNRSAAVFNGLVQGPADRLTYVQNRLAEMIGQPIAVAGVDPSSDLITTSSAHGLAANDPVRIKALGAGALPGGLSAGTVYYVLYQSTSTTKLALTPGGTAVDITSAGTGPLYLYKVGSSAVTDKPIIGLWVQAGGNGGTAYRPNFIAAGGTNSYHYPLDLPDGARLSSLKLRVDPTNVGSLPTTMPQIAIVKIDLLTGTVVPVGDADDTSADTTIYNSAHDITMAALTEVVNLALYWYRLDFTSSSGDPTDNAITVLGPPRVSMTEVRRLVEPG